MNLNLFFNILLISICIFIIFSLLCIFFIGETIPANDDIIFPSEITINENISEIFKKEDINEGFLLRSPNYVFNEQSNTDFCLFYLCGFNATTNEAYDVINEISKITTHMAIIPRMPGQSLWNEEMSYNGTTVYDYLKRIYLIALHIKTYSQKQIILISSSTGCAYAIWLSYKFGKQLKIFKSFMLSPNIEPAGMGSFLTKLCLLPCGSFLIKILKYRIYLNNDILNTSIFYNLLGILNIVRKIKFKKNYTPISIFLNKNDKIIDANKCIEYYNNYVGDKRIHFIDTDEHNIINVENLKDNIISTIVSEL